MTYYEGLNQRSQSGPMVRATVRADRSSWVNYSGAPQAKWFHVQKTDLRVIAHVSIGSNGLANDGSRGEAESQIKRTISWDRLFDADMKLSSIVCQDSRIHTMTYYEGPRIPQTHRGIITDKGTGQDLSSWMNIVGLHC